jgi:hypothetical protein
VGWIGLGGATIGAGAAILGGWIQQRQQVKTDRQKLIEERGQTAGHEALAVLYALRRHIASWDPGLDAEGREAWVLSGQEMADEADMAVGLVPESREIRVRMEEALSVVRSRLGQDRLRTTSEAYSTAILTTHAIDILQTFLRGGEPLPPRSLQVERLREQRAAYPMGNPPESY